MFRAYLPVDIGSAISYPWMLRSKQVTNALTLGRNMEVVEGFPFSNILQLVLSRQYDQLQKEETPFIVGTGIKVLLKLKENVEIEFLVHICFIVLDRKTWHANNNLSRCPADAERSLREAKRSRHLSLYIRATCQSQL